MRTCRQASENFDCGVVALKREFLLFWQLLMLFSKEIWQLESMRAEVIQITFIVKILLFLTDDLLCHVLKAPKFTETFTSKLGLDKGYFDRIYGTLFSLVNARSSSLKIFVNNKSVKTIFLVVFEFMLIFLFLI